MEFNLFLTVGLLLCLGIGLVIGFLLAQKLSANKANQREHDIQAQLTAQHMEQMHNLQLQLAAALQAKQTLEQQLNISQEKELLLTEAQMQLAALESEYRTFKQSHLEWQANLKQRWDNEYKTFLLEHLGLAQNQFAEKATKEQIEKQRLLNENIENLLKPMAEKLDNLQKETIGLSQSNKELKVSASRLTMTLSDNKHRGNWGEAQLERLLEESGLQKGIHYFTQERVGLKMPDIRVQLPENRHILIDAKALHIDLEELNMTEEQLVDKNYQEISQRKMAQSLENAIKDLAGKNYTSDVESAVSFVVLFVPKESMLANAMVASPGLFERAYQNNIILAGPYNLMGLLKLVNQGWRMDKLSRQANEILNLGQDLYKQAYTFAAHFDKVGQQIEQLTDAYRKTTTSFNGKQGFIKKIKTLEAYGADTKAKGKIADEVTEPTPFIHTPELLTLPHEPYLVESEMNPHEVAV